MSSSFIHTGLKSLAPSSTLTDYVFRATVPITFCLVVRSRVYCVTLHRPLVWLCLLSVLL